MKTLGRILLAAAALVLLAFPLFAQQDCPNDKCPYPASTVRTITYEWRAGATPDEAALYENGRQVGGFHYVQSVYRHLANGRWSAPTNPPITVPARMTAMIEQNFGLDLAKLKAADDAPTYKHSGKPVSREAAMDILAKGLPNDGDKLWLTLIGSDDDRKRTEADLPADVKDRVKLSSFKPDSWQVQPGFVTTGSPTLYLQAPAGKVLHRQDDYKAGDFQAIRKAVAGYDSKKDLDVRAPALPSPANVFTPQNIILGGLLAAVAALYFNQRKVAV